MIIEDVPYRQIRLGGYIAVSRLMKAIHAGWITTVRILMREDVVVWRVACKSQVRNFLSVGDATKLSRFCAHQAAIATRSSLHHPRRVQ